MLDFTNGLVYWEPSRNAVRNGEGKSTRIKLTKQMILLIASKLGEEEEVVLVETRDKLIREWTKAFHDVSTT